MFLNKKLKSSDIAKIAKRMDIQILFFLLMTYNNFLGCIYTSLTIYYIAMT